MANIEEELSKLHPVEESVENSDAAVFGNMKKKRKRKDKLFSEVSSILDEEDTGDDDMLAAFHFKARKKKRLDDDEDLFDTRGKDSKKTKNLEAKFRAELGSLQKLLKDNEATAKTIQAILEPILTSKARGSSKMLSDLIMALNSSNNNRLATLREISSLKKSIIDLKIKISKDDKNDGEGVSQEQFGSMLFDQLFKHGRANVINTANSYNPDMEDFVNANNGRSFDDICNDRLNNEAALRSESSTKMIEYEKLQPEIVILKSFTGETQAIALDNEGNKIEDYPVPTEDQLGKLSFNTENGTCTDRTGRVYKVIEV